MISVLYWALKKEKIFSRQEFGLPITPYCNFVVSLIATVKELVSLWRDNGSGDFVVY